MRKLVLTTLASTALLASAPAFAQDADTQEPLALEERESPFSDMAERMRDPENQRQMALMLRTMSEVLLDMPLAPLMNSLGEIAGEDAPKVDPDATLRSVAPQADRVPEAIEKNLPRALDTMGSMADAFEQMMPALEQMAERLKDAAPQAD
ncbi:hypothetical protein GRI69_11115 [Erythrobacter vulgaris]|uniref:DUF2059 domain-containing protein n=1 Tax=Qipengyuania vulgaris TaxID=291985 RepID=A0A844XT87_9SPHN|nr:hypothetical protein [Qipengyuania vulgaris]MXO48806.1 hypothetical protein [Qipengyuania vulgaris]